MSPDLSPIEPVWEKLNVAVERRESEEWDKLSVVSVKSKVKQFHVFYLKSK